jgi:hypothetical protein
VVESLVGEGESKGATGAEGCDKSAGVRRKRQQMREYLCLLFLSCLDGAGCHI